MCSNGAPYQSTADLPFATQPGSDSLPDCVPRCGSAHGLDGAYGIDALPQGACTEPLACKLAARERCADPAVEGPLTVFRCDCVSSAFTCAVLERGARICSAATPPDGGTQDSGANK